MNVAYFYAVLVTTVAFGLAILLMFSEGQLTTARSKVHEVEMLKLGLVQKVAEVERDVAHQQELLAICKGQRGL